MAAFLPQDLVDPFGLAAGAAPAVDDGMATRAVEARRADALSHSRAQATVAQRPPFPSDWGASPEYRESWVTVAACRKCDGTAVDLVVTPARHANGARVLRERMGPFVIPFLNGVHVGCGAERLSTGPRSSGFRAA